MHHHLRIDLLTVLIAAVLNMIIGFFWYSRWLFGPLWLKECKIKPEEGSQKQAMIWAFLVSLVTAYFLALFECYVGVTSVIDGMLIGFFLWLGFVATTQVSAVIWCKHTLRGFMIDTGYKLLSFLVMGGVIGA